MMNEDDFLQKFGSGVVRVFPKVHGKETLTPFLQQYQELKVSSLSDFHLNLEQKGKNIRCLLMTRDFPGLFTIASACFFCSGYRVVSARSFSEAQAAAEGQKIVLDSFELIPEEENPAQAGKSALSLEQIDARLRSCLGEWIQVAHRQGMSAVRNLIHEAVGELLEEKAGTAEEGILSDVDIQLFPHDEQSILQFRGPVFPAYVFTIANAVNLQQLQIQDLICRETKFGRFTLELSVTRRQAFVKPGEAQQKAGIEPSTWEGKKSLIMLCLQFVHMLPHAPDRGLAVQQFYDFAEGLLQGEDKADQFFMQEGISEFLSILARIFGTGKYLWEEFTKRNFISLRGMLGELETLKDFHSSGAIGAELHKLLATAQGFDDSIRIVNEFKDRMLFQVDLTHQAFPGYSFADFSKQVGVLTEVVLELLMQLCYKKLSDRYGEPGQNTLEGNRWVLLALGKFGGNELGYASDLELMLVYDVPKESESCKITASEFYEKLLRLFRKSVWAKHEGIFELDLRLRPYGESGPLPVSFSSFKKYYAVNGECLDYERQALIKLRAVAGDLDFGWELEHMRDSFVYTDLAPDVKGFSELRQKQIQHLAAIGSNAKFSPGALVDVEYAVQLLQRQYGRQFGELRTQNTRKALVALMERQILSPREFELLNNAYAWYRRLINNLRIVRGNAKDLQIPARESAEFAYLARRMGLQHKEGRTRLQESMQHYFQGVASFMNERFYLDTPFGQSELPEVEAARSSLVDVMLLPTPEEISHESNSELLQTLKELNLADPEKAAAMLIGFYQKQLHSGAAGGAGEHGALISLVVLAGEHVCRAPDPDTVFLQFLDFLSNLAERGNYIEKLFFHPEYLEMIFSVFGTSDFLSSVLQRSPEWILDLLSSGNLHRQKSVWEYTQDLNQIYEETADDSQNLDSQTSDLEPLRIFRNRELLRIALRDLYFKVGMEETVRSISYLSDAVVHFALMRSFLKFGKMRLFGNQAVIALGKLGAGELNYSSDIDLVFVYFGNRLEENRKDLERVYRNFIRELSAPSPWGQLFRVDLNLRPYGAQGNVVNSRESYEKYFESLADGWELQAWMRARPISGAVKQAEELIHIAAKTALQEERYQGIFPSILELRNKVLERLVADGIEEREIKSGVGGIRTIEFFVQKKVLELAFRSYSVHEGLPLMPGATLDAIRMLKENEGASMDFDQLRQDYIFLREIEHRLQLFGMQQIHLMPDTKDEIQKLALRMGFRDKIGLSARKQLKKKWFAVKQRLQALHSREFTAENSNRNNY